jgi:flavodoxin
MKSLVLYGSEYGNTQRIAEAVARGLGEGAEVHSVASAGESMDGVQLLAVGSPTQGGRPVKEVSGFISRLRPGSLKGVRVAAFDTRFSAQAHGFGLRVFMKVLGFAAPRIARALQAKGGDLIAPAEGFVVADKEGPLVQGELERAEALASRFAGGSP